MNHTADTFEATIYMAGDVADAKRWLRRRCYERGLCVTIAPCDFIYTGGEEAGFRVGLVSYPRFPSSPDEVHAIAVEIASSLVVECCQKTALVVSGLRSEWIHVEPLEPVSMHLPHGASYSQSQRAPGARKSGAESK